MAFSLCLAAIGVTVYVLFVKLFPILSGVEQQTAATTPSGPRKAAGGAV